MALFNRKKKDNVLPEVEQYYQAERRDRSWLAWVLALASVAVVVLIIAGLFLAGRWAYNEIAGNDDDVAEISVEDTENGDADDDLTVDGDPNDTESEEQAETPAPNGSEQATNQNGQGTVNAPAQTTTPSNSGTEATTPRTGDDPLPSTGAGSLVGVFAGVSTLAGGLHYAVERRKRS